MAVDTDRARLRCHLPLLGLVAGLLVASCTPERDIGPAGGGIDGMIPAGPFPGEPGEVWVTPSGRRIVPGTVDLSAWPSVVGG